MRIATIAAIAVVGAAGAAAADPMAGAYKNTVAITYPNGAVTKMFIDEDGTYSAKAPDGATVKGTWKVENGSTCFTQAEPAPPAGTPANCSPTVERKAGDSWTAPGPNGSTLSISIVVGR
jgi:hypothetical protein